MQKGTFDRSNATITTHSAYDVSSGFVGRSGTFESVPSILVITRLAEINTKYLVTGLMSEERFHTHLLSVVGVLVHILSVSPSTLSQSFTNPFFSHRSFILVSFTRKMMEHSDWDSVLQYVADPLEMDFSGKHHERSDIGQPVPTQVPTPPVRSKN